MTQGTDKSAVNELLLARNGRAKVLRSEMEGIKMPVSFRSAEAKRMFLRMFESFQICAHFISFTAKSRIADDADRVLVDAHFMALRGTVDAARAKLDAALDDAEAQFKAYGIAPPCIFESVPLCMTVNVGSSTEKRFLEVILQLDHVMELLQALEIHEVLSIDTRDMQRAKLKRAVRDVLKTARQLAAQLRQQMDVKWARAQD